MSTARTVVRELNNDYVTAKVNKALPIHHGPAGRRFSMLYIHAENRGRMCWLFSFFTERVLNLYFLSHDADSAYLAQVNG